MGFQTNKKPLNDLFIERFFFRFASVVKLMMSLSMIFSYPLQIYVAVEIINSYVQDKLDSKLHLKAEYMLRLILVLVTFTLAAAIPRFFFACFDFIKK